MMKKNIEAEKYVMSVLAHKKSIYELTFWVRNHAQYLKWFCNYPQKTIDEVLVPFMNLSNHLYNKGLNKDKQAVDEFRHLSVITTLALEECDE